jgi:hypothetical protein
MRSKAPGIHLDDHVAGALGVAARRHKVYAGWMTEKLLKNPPAPVRARDRVDRVDRVETVRRAAARAALR